MTIHKSDRNKHATDSNEHKFAPWLLQALHTNHIDTRLSRVDCVFNQRSKLLSKIKIPQFKTKKKNGKLFKHRWQSKIVHNFQKIRTWIASVIFVSNEICGFVWSTRIFSTGLYVTVTYRPKRKSKCRTAFFFRLSFELRFVFGLCCDLIWP